MQNSLAYAPNIAQNLPENQLATEIARGLDELPSILKRYGLNNQEFVRLSRDPTFRARFVEAKRAWEHPDAADVRIINKSRFAVEDCILVLYGLATDPEVAGMTRIEAFKQLARIAKVDGGEPKESGAASGSQFVVNIAIGDEHMRTSINPAPIEALANESEDL